MAALPPGLVTRQKSRLGCWEARGCFGESSRSNRRKQLEAWEALYAEGSDWFWFGEGHSSNQDAIFDRLFREHLCGIYKALNEPPLIYTNQKPTR